VALNNGTANRETQKIYGDMLNAKPAAEDGLKLADFIPAPNSIVVKPAPADEMTHGGLIIPAQAQIDKSFGHIIAVNPDDAGCQYKVGQLIYFRHDAGSMIQIEGQDVVVMEIVGDGYSDILGYWPADKLEDKQECA